MGLPYLLFINDLKSLSHGNSFTALYEMMKQKTKHDSKGTTSTNVQKVVKNKTTVAIVLLLIC